MAYRQFTLNSFCKKFGITPKELSIFEKIECPVVVPSQHLLTELEQSKRIPYLTEKAKSELFVTPILKFLTVSNDFQFSYFSGYILAGDKKAGLNGECDFIFSTATNTKELTTPIFNLVEAKNDNIENGLGQCAAQMLGARFFNQKNDGAHIQTIYGCVTNSFEWVFLKLENNTIFIDIERYYLGNLSQLLGILQYIISQYKKQI
ncbi:MAG: hypothetical protein RLZZ292_3137 [Bacteroidota bacterium]|jgi:hypothetical protein